jgi:hypothetical protein
LTNITGEIVIISNTSIELLRSDTGRVGFFLYVANGTFNHSYIGDVITIGINDEGIAVSCINKRHGKMLTL